MIGRYANDKEVIVGGFDEEHCMNQLLDLIKRNGELVWYSGYTDEDYEAGEYIGRENFIYD